MPEDGNCAVNWYTKQYRLNRLEETNFAQFRTNFDTNHSTNLNSTTFENSYEIIYTYIHIYRDKGHDASY